MFYTPEGLSHNSWITVGMSVNMNNPSERNPLGQFLVPLDVKQKTVVHILRSFKTNFKSSERIVPYVVVFKIGGVLQKSMPVLNKLYYNCVLYHPQVFQYPLPNDWLKSSIGGHT